MPICNDIDPTKLSAEEESTIHNFSTLSKPPDDDGQAGRQAGTAHKRRKKGEETGPYKSNFSYLVSLKSRCQYIFKGLVDMNMKIQIFIHDKKIQHDTL